MKFRDFRNPGWHVSTVLPVELEGIFSTDLPDTARDVVSAFCQVTDKPVIFSTQGGLKFKILVNLACE